MAGKTSKTEVNAENKSKNGRENQVPNGNETDQDDRAKKTEHLQEEDAAVEVQNIEDSYMMTWWRAVDEMKHGSTYRSLGLGMAMGCLTSQVGARFGKKIATLVGGSMLVLHAANQKGYITVNWRRVKNDMEEAERTKDGLLSAAVGKKPKGVGFVSNGRYIGVGFVCGLLAGLAYSSRSAS